MMDFLSEASPVSTTRIMAIVCTMCACGIAIYGIIMNRDLVGLAALCSAFITPAFAAKVVQKHFENKSE